MNSAALLSKPTDCTSGWNFRSSELEKSIAMTTACSRSESVGLRDEEQRRLIKPLCQKQFRHGTDFSHDRSRFNQLDIGSLTISINF